MRKRWKKRGRRWGEKNRWDEREEEEEEEEEDGVSERGEKRLSKERER